MSELSKIFSKSVFLLLTLVIIVCIIYPITLWIVGQTFFPFQANGSLLKDKNNTIIGSKLIAQPFVSDLYFKPRPSAANYDAGASTSSALAASNNALRERVVALIAKTSSRDENGLIPADFVTTSASGLDPHISLQNALLQLDSVATAWSGQLNRDKNAIKDEILKLISSRSEAPWNGLIGEAYVNVLEINLELHEKYLGPL